MRSGGHSLRLPRTAWFGVFGLLLTSAGCHGNVAAPESSDAGTIFVAFAPDFTGFRLWPSALAVPSPALPPPPGDGVARGDAGSDAGAAADAAVDSGIHTGTLTVYWKQAPPSGSTSFPEGTLIVKETDGGDVTTRQVFAMAKRGGDFNPSGAVDWEWFELQNIDDTYVRIIWRGDGPPANEVYGGNPATCNVCHDIARANDYVWSSALDLSNF